MISKLFTRQQKKTTIVFPYLQLYIVCMFLFSLSPRANTTTSTTAQSPPPPNPPTASKRSRAARSNFQMYSSALRTSPTAELLGTYGSSAYGAQPSYFANSNTSASGMPAYRMTAYDPSATHPSSLLGGHTGLGGGGGGLGLLGPPSSPPRRRYSIGGLPSASITEYLNLMQNANESAHISNLLNETSKSITRSSQILGVSGDPGLPNPGTLAGYTSALTGMLADQTAASAAVAAAAAASSAAANASGAGLLGSDHLMPLSLTNFSSHPNIYSQPSGGGGGGLYGPQSASSAFFDPSATSLAAQLGPLDHSAYLSHQKPFTNFLFSRPTHHTATGAHLPYTSSSIAPPPPLSSSYPHPLHTPYHRSLSQSRQNLYVPSHHTSNPALSTGCSWLPGGGGGGGADTYATAAAINSGLYPSSLPHHMSSHLPSAAYGSGVGGVGGGGSGLGYSNQHFDHHYFQDPLSKLDLDYSRQGETKRQVSFKFDVDTLSVDS